MRHLVNSVLRLDKLGGDVPVENTIVRSVD